MKVKPGSTTFLKVIILLFGIAVLTVCIFLLPEAARRDTIERPGDYSLYPLLICAYGICITFSVALYQVFEYSQANVPSMTYILPLNDKEFTNECRDIYHFTSCIIIEHTFRYAIIYIGGIFYDSLSKDIGIAR